MQNNLYCPRSQPTTLYLRECICHVGIFFSKAFSCSFIFLHLLPVDGIANQKENKRVYFNLDTSVYCVMLC